MTCYVLFLEPMKELVPGGGRRPGFSDGPETLAFNSSPIADGFRPYENQTGRIGEYCENFI